MTASDKCVALIKEFEGFRADPYCCPAGFWTVGYGCRFYRDGKPVRASDPAIDECAATDILSGCLTSYEAAVEDAVTSELSQNQFDALVSFTYNCGVRAFCKSTLLKRVNADPRDPRIRDELLRWTKVGRKESRGLMRRRQAEAKLYFSRATSSQA